MTGDSRSQFKVDHSHSWQAALRTLLTRRCRNWHFDW